LVDERGVPLSMVLSGANTHDVKLPAATLDGLVVARPSGAPPRQNFCLDAGYVGEPAKREIEGRGYVPHVRPRGEEIAEMGKNPGFKARRWVVEVRHSWFNRFRKLPVRYEKMDRSCLGLLMLAASVIVLRKINPKNQRNIIYG
jgi:putative transposase